jgi:acyl carrier protein
MSVSEIVLNELEKVTGTDQVHKDLNLDLFGEKILDSFGTVELIVALSDSLRHRNFPRPNRPRAMGHPAKDHRVL